MIQFGKTNSPRERIRSTVYWLRSTDRSFGDMPPQSEIYVHHTCEQLSVDPVFSCMCNSPNSEFGISTSPELSVTRRTGVSHGADPTGGSIGYKKLGIRPGPRDSRKNFALPHSRCKTVHLKHLAFRSLRWPPIRPQQTVGTGFPMYSIQDLCARAQQNICFQERSFGLPCWFHFYTLTFPKMKLGPSRIPWLP